MDFKSSMLAIVASVTLASGAQASDRLEASLNLRAEVAPFCRIDASEREIGQDGEIGAVTEVCNTPGYSVVANFANIASGEVVAGDERVSLTEEGRAVFTSSEARRVVRQWQLASAVRRDPAAPVLVRFSISPL